MTQQGERDTTRSQAVVIAAEDYAARCVESTGRKFDIGELLNLKSWFYAGARWARSHPDGDVQGPQSSTMSGSCVQPERPTCATCRHMPRWMGICRQGVFYPRKAADGMQDATFGCILHEPVPDSAKEQG